MTLATPMRLSALGVAAVLFVRTAGSTTVPAGANLQEYIDRAHAGDVLVLEPGATYVGNFVLPARTGEQYITIRSAGGGAGPPGAGAGVLPVDPRLPSH